MRSLILLLIYVFMYSIIEDMCRHNIIIVLSQKVKWGWRGV